MDYRRLGHSGLRVSAVSLGTWLTFGGSLDLSGVKEMVRVSLDAGINMFDTAEVYSQGLSEYLLGEALQGVRREELVISTKIFWGGQGPNLSGLSRKHLVEGTKNSLRRLHLEYVDLLFCHRPDPETPLLETLYAMDYLVRQGFALYWGTSEWSAKDLETAFALAHTHHLIPPTMEQPEYNLFHRYRMEVEYEPLCQKYGLGTTTWSPLASGILTGKYNDQIPQGTRLESHKFLKERLSREKIEKAQMFAQIASEHGLSPSCLAIAWCLKNPRVSTVILGASKVSQLQENLQALELSKTLDSTVLAQLEEIFPCQEEIGVV